MVSDLLSFESAWQFDAKHYFLSSLLHIFYWLLIGRNFYLEVFISPNLMVTAFPHFCPFTIHSEVSHGLQDDCYRIVWKKGYGILFSRSSFLRLATAFEDDCHRDIRIHCSSYVFMTVVVQSPVHLHSILWTIIASYFDEDDDDVFSSHEKGVAWLGLFLWQLFEFCSWNNIVPPYDSSTIQTNCTVAVKLLIIERLLVIWKVTIKTFVMFTI